MDQTDRPPDGSESADLPLAWEGRVFAVGLFWSITGFMAGALAALPLSAIDVTPLASMAVGSVLGFMAGGLLEAGYCD
jgi:hypothetical protein